MTSPDDLPYLLNLLEDEFARVEGARVVPVPAASTRRSADLPQDYDPENSDLHSRAGVQVRVGKRELFFPLEWYREPSRARLREALREARALLGGLD